MLLFKGFALLDPMLVWCRRLKPRCCSSSAVCILAKTPPEVLKLCQWEFRKIRGTFLGVPIIRILIF